MAIWIDPEKCNGCYGAAQPPCLRMCPGDLIVKDAAANKAYLKYVNDCWDCLPCVKVCPEEAIEFHLSPQFAPIGTVLPIPFFHCAIAKSVAPSDYSFLHSEKKIDGDLSLLSYNF